MRGSVGGAGRPTSQERSHRATPMLPMSEILEMGRAFGTLQFSRTAWGCVMSIGFNPAPQKRRPVEPPSLVPQTNGFPYEEFRFSAIPDWYTEKAIEYYTGGRTLVEALVANALTGRNGAHQGNDYLTQHDAWWVSLYEEACSNGGWLLGQATLTGCSEPNPYIKLNTPRRDRNGKIIKYEGGAKQVASPLLLPVTWGMGIERLEQFCPQRVRAEYQRRFEASGAGENDFDEGWWDFVEQHPCIPIVIAEGGKKGMSLEVRERSSLVLRGIDNFFQKRVLKTDPLVPHEVCDRLLVKGRPVVIAFDKDDKPKTVKRVEAALDRIGRWLEKRKCKVSIASWDKELGKGIDDALYAIQSERGEEAARQWLSETISNANSYKSWKRSKNVERTLEKINRLNTLSFPIERATEGEYLPDLPPLRRGAIHVLRANTGSGKTCRIGMDWVKSWAKSNGMIPVLSPLNSLGKQTAQDWDLPHIHSYPTDEEGRHALWTDVNYRQGCVLCYDSLHRLPSWFFEKDGKPLPILLILDEANQGIKHLVEGQTLGARWGEIVGRFSAIVRHAIQYGAIVLSEDGIPDRAVEFVRSVATAGHEGEEVPVRAIDHRKVAEPWDVTIYEGSISGFRAELLSAIGEGKRILFETSSQIGGEILEREVAKRFPGKKFVRLDSTTNESGSFERFFAAPDEWLKEERPDILSISPSAKTGISIDGGKSAEGAYFDEIWGQFTSCDTDSAIQFLGRDRAPIPRHVFVPSFIPTSGDEAIGSSWATAARLKLNAEGLGRAIDLDDSETERTERERAIEQACIDYISKSLTVSGAQKSIAKDALVDRLERAGHIVTFAHPPHDKEVGASWKNTLDEIWRDRARYASGLEIDPEVHTRDWALKVLASSDAGREVRTKAQKVLWRDEFPGITFDDFDECYEAIYRDYGRMKRGVKMQAMTECPYKARYSESQAIADILGGKLRALHRLPKSSARALLLHHLGILELLDGESYSNTDPRAIAVKERALKFRNEVWYWLGLNVNDEQTPVEVCHKLLKRLGLERSKKDRPGAIETVGRPGKRGELRDRIFRVNLAYCAIRVRLLEAYRRKLSEAQLQSVSSICHQGNVYIQIEDTKPKIPIKTKSERDVEGLKWMLLDLATDESFDRGAMLDLTQGFSQEQKQKVWETLPPETRSTPNSSRKHDAVGGDEPEMGFGRVIRL